MKILFHVWLLLVEALGFSLIFVYAIGIIFSNLLSGDMGKTGVIIFIAVATPLLMTPIYLKLHEKTNKFFALMIFILNAFLAGVLADQEISSIGKISMVEQIKERTDKNYGLIHQYRNDYTQEVRLLEEKIASLTNMVSGCAK